MSTIKINGNADSSEYLAEVPQIQLNSGFQASLDAAVNSINDNFKKLVSLPFLQGDKGNSIFEVPIAFCDGDIGAKMKRAVCECIYGAGNTSPNDAPYGGGAAQGFGNSWDASVYDSVPIVFYRHKETDSEKEKYFYAAREFFMFTDCRLRQLGQDLANIPVSWYSSFVDLSCAVSITATTLAKEEDGMPDESQITFTAKKHTIVPTLYYDSNSKYWCWSVNGVKTGVIAQGVKGDSGARRGVFVCKGKKISNPPDNIPPVQHNNGIVIISKILQPSGFTSITEDKIYTKINTDDLVCVWFQDEGGPNALATTTMNNCTFGLAKNHTTTDPLTNETTGYTYIDNSTPDGITLDLATMISETTLFRWLNDICSTEVSPDPNNNPAVRGLYIPDGKPDAAVKNIHMFWSDGDMKASLGLGDLDDRTVDRANLPVNNNGNVLDWDDSDKSELTLWYPTIRCHRSTAYRILSNYTMTGGINPSDFSSQNLKDFSGAGTSSSSYALSRQEPIASAISLIGPKEDNPDDETLVSSAGLYIRRNAANYINHSADIPAVYIDHGKYGKSYIKKGAVHVEDGRIYISKTSSYTQVPTRFETRYDGGEDSYTDAIDNEIKTRRWEMTVDNPNSVSAYIQNPGVKMTKADAVVHGGTVVVSSDNGYKSLFIRDNKLMFDYKAYAELSGYSGNTEAVHERRPRYPQYAGIQLGGYNTIYNFITSNADVSGKVKASGGVLDNLRDPIILTPDQNKQYALLSGKSGYTAMIENWGPANIRNVDGAYNTSWTQSDGSTAVADNPEARPWGLVTTYSSIWTKIGNVVDVKGKIFFTKTRYTPSNGSSMPQIISNQSRPITYAEFFRFMKRYGNAEAFPLPIVVNTGTSTSPVYKVSVGNTLDNIDGTSVVNMAGISSFGNGIQPAAGVESAEIYHNRIYNGSAQFHFYGSKNDDIGYGSTPDAAIGFTESSVGLPNNSYHSLDMLNNVFTVTADISKTAVYDDRYWTFSAIPNYDAINYQGEIGSSSKSWLDQKDLNSPKFGPIRIVRYENSTNTKTDDDNYNTGGSANTAAKYNYAHGILGINWMPSGDFTVESSGNTYENDRNPTKYFARGGKITIPFNVSSTGPSNVNQAHWLRNNYINNLRSYKLSLNIGSYFIRYITFAFSYLLDDDVQLMYNNSGSSAYSGSSTQSADADAWNVPNNINAFQHTSYYDKVSDWGVITDDQNNTER